MFAILTACGGFLIAVLWMDLMFDVQVLRHRGAQPLPETVLASIAGYYRRVTTDARPMTHLIAAVMVVAMVTLAVHIASGHTSVVVSIPSLLLCGVPVGLAGVRIVPNAMRLGARLDPLETQSALARAICRDHLFCLASVGAFVALQLLAAG